MCAGESTLVLLQVQGITSHLGQQAGYCLLAVQCDAFRQGVTVGEQQLVHSAPEIAILFKLQIPQMWSRESFSFCP